MVCVCVCVCVRVRDSLQALFECGVDLLQPLGLGVTRATAPLVCRQMGLLGLGQRLLLAHRIPHEGVTPTHAYRNTHIHELIHRYTKAQMVVISRFLYVLCRNVLS